MKKVPKVVQLSNYVFCLLEIESHSLGQGSLEPYCVAQADLQLMGILVQQPPEC